MGDQAAPAGTSPGPGPRERALVTGASSGIGAALARRLAARGVEVWLAARRLERLQAVAADIAAAGGSAHPVVLDVAEPDACAAAVERLDDEIGGLDLVIANAGVSSRASAVASLTWADARAVFQTNLMGALATLLPVIPRMVARGRGHIVGVSSLSAEVPLPVGPDYATTKSALSFYLRCAQADLPRRGVAVTLIHPGFVKTDLVAGAKFPMPQLLEVDEAARIMDDGIRRRASMVRFPAGLAALASLGARVPPGVVGAVLARVSR